MWASNNNNNDSKKNEEANFYSNTFVYNDE